MGQPYCVQGGPASKKQNNEIAKSVLEAPCHKNDFEDNPQKDLREERLHVRVAALEELVDEVSS